MSIRKVDPKLQEASAANFNSLLELFGTVKQIPPMKMKETGKMFKAVKGAAKSGVGGITSMMGSLGAFSVSMGALDAILKPLEPILKVVGSLFEMMGGAIMKSIMPGLQPLLELIMEFSPLFTTIGDIIGTLMLLGLKPLAAILDVILIFIEPLLPFLQDFADALDLLSPVFDIIAGVIKDVFITGFYLLARTIAGIIYVVTLGIVDLGAAVDNFFADLFGEDTSTTTTPTYTPSAPTTYDPATAGGLDSPLGAYNTYHSGGTVRGRGNVGAVLKGGEEVFTEARMDDLVRSTELQTRYLKRLVDLKEDKW